MRRVFNLGALALGTLLISGCVYDDYGCFAEADVEPVDITQEANAYLASVASEDDKGRNRTYRRESTRRNDHYRRDSYNRGGYRDRRRPYGC